MNKKERMQKDIEDSLKHEDELQHDDNEEPVTYINLDDVKTMEHKENVENDKNKDPVTFAEDSDNED